jgi:hypothetical protein
MPTWKQVVEKYGQEMSDKMADTGLLDAITCVMTPAGEADIPQCDIDLAYRAANGGEIRGWDWD